MKKLGGIALGILTVLVVGCKNDQPLPKVIYDKKDQAAKAEKKESDTLTLVDLPIQFDGTQVLLFPVGKVAMYEDKGVKETTYSEIPSHTVSNTSEFEIAGTMTNLKFQVKDTDSLRVLTDKKVLISRVSYLSALAASIKKQLLVYEMEDADTNQDGAINESDIHGLYISALDGTGFQKISPDLQEVIGWNVIHQRGRLYFRTLEDANKNGAFDKSDIVHYFYVDCKVNPLQVHEYFPLK